VEWGSRSSATRKKGKKRRPQFPQFLSSKTREKRTENPGCEEGYQRKPCFPEPIKGEGGKAFGKDPKGKEKKKKKKKKKNLFMKGSDQKRGKKKHYSRGNVPP